jgi:hypothetical protein
MRPASHDGSLRAAMPQSSTSEAIFEARGGHAAARELTLQNAIALNDEADARGLKGNFVLLYLAFRPCPKRLAYRSAAAFNPPKPLMNSTSILGGRSR